MANNLVYATTIYNREFLKRRIKKADLESFTTIFSMMDSTDDHFGLFDIYKIFLFCSKAVLE